MHWTKKLNVKERLERLQGLEGSAEVLLGLKPGDLAGCDVRQTLIDLNNKVARRFREFARKIVRAYWDWIQEGEKFPE